MAREIKNPVLRGFHPDPSILRVGEDYYIATSTFQWFPGVEIYHSKDLVNWEFVTRPLDEKRLIDMTGVPDSGGVWAPCLSYSDGIFYLVYSNIKTYRITYQDVDNYLTTSKSLTGPWSDPVYLNSSGFDASMFHDTDGKKYLLNMVCDHRDKQNNAFWGIVLQEYNAEEKRLTGQPVRIFTGSSLKFTEGPHIYKINGWYYLMCAEGGTFYNHAVTMARARAITGPYEISPIHPLITSKGHPELTLQKSGHGSLVETPGGEWYVAHLCGRPNGNGDRCMLGRETAIQKVTLREDGWFELEHPSGLPQETTPAPDLPEMIIKKETSIKKTFKGKLPDEFQTLRVPLDKCFMDFNNEKESLILYGKESMESLHIQSLVGRRRTDFFFEAETEMLFEPYNFQQAAGMALYYDTTNYFYLQVSTDENQRKYIALLECNHGKTRQVGEKQLILNNNQPVIMKLIVNNDKADFYWSYEGEENHKIGETLDATQISDDYYDEAKHGLRFTGGFIVLCCQDLSGQRCLAEFSYFSYRSFDKQ